MTSITRSIFFFQNIGVVRILIVFLLMLTTWQVNAQRKYSGKLIKQKNGKAAVNVELQVVGLGDVTYTDLSGVFALYDYSSNPDSLKVSVVDKRFEPMEFTVYAHDFSTYIITKRLEKWKPPKHPIIPTDTINDPSLIKIVPDQEFITTPPHAALYLQHTVPGITVTQPGSDPNGYYQIINRGLSSAAQRNYPLVIIDGMPEMTLERINPEDIQLMTVGNTATTGAQYGMMGGAGVIQVQTMRYDTAMPTLRYHNSLSGAFGEVGVPVMDAAEYLTYKPNHDEGNDTDWQRAVMRNAYSNRHHLSLAVGSERNGIYASLGHQKENGVLRYSGFQQNHARLNMHGVSRSGKTTVTLTSYIAQRDAERPDQYAFREAVFYNPTRAVYDSSGNLTTTGSSERPNPVGNLLEDRSLARTREWTAGLHLEHRTPKNWEWDYSVSVRKRGFYTGNLSQGLTPRMFYSSSDRQHGFARIGMRKKYQIKKAIFRHWTSVEASILLEENRFFTIPDTDSVNIDFELLMDPFSVWDEDGDVILDEKTEQDKMMASGNIGGSLEFNTFELSGGGRYDRLFYENGHAGRWFFHSRVSSDLKPMLTADWINRSRLSLGFGKTGLAYITDIFSSQYLANTRGGEYVPRQDLNDDQLNEAMTEIDLQLDFSFFKDRLSATVNVYNKNLIDQQLGDYSDGEIGIRGWDVLLGYQMVKNKKLDWRSIVRFSAYRASIYSYGSEPEPTPIEFAIFLFNYEEIELEHYGPVGQIQGYKTDGTITFGRYNSLDLDGDFRRDRTMLGKAHPSFGIAYTSQLKFGPWDGALRMRSMIGHDLINTYRYRGEMLTSLEQNMVNTADFNEDRRFEENVIHDIFVEKASFLKLDLLVLGYKLPMKKAHLRFYLMGENLLTLTNYSGIDPEPRYQRSGIALAGGMEELDTYFRSKRITIGAQLAL